MPSYPTEAPDNQKYSTARSVNRYSEIGTSSRIRNDIDYKSCDCTPPFAQLPRDIVGKA